MKLKQETIQNVVVVTPELHRLDVQSVPDFKQATATLPSPRVHLAMDLHQIQFIDSTGLGALLSLLRRVKELGGTMVLVNAGEQVLAMFRLVKMTRVFELYESIAEAIASLDE
jgi:anti-sigma B factor antagonist